VQAASHRGKLAAVSWTFVYLMLALKIPILALLYIVWWAIKQSPEPADEHRGDGGSKRPPLRPHPRKPFPRRPRRGPHGDPAPASPPRTRSVLVARARNVHRA
jgi:hypothetical protein